MGCRPRTTAKLGEIYAIRAEYLEGGEDGEPVDLTGYTGEVDIRPRSVKNDPTETLTMTFEAPNAFRVDVDTSKTIYTPQVYFWDVRIQKGSESPIYTDVIEMHLKHPSTVRQS